MSAAAPWSVKGIDPKAREIAKDLARRSGMTLGEWLNSMIMEDTDEDEGYTPLPRRPHAVEAFDRRGRSRRLDDAYAPGDDAWQRLSASVDAIAARLEAAERRSTVAIQGVDQAVAGLVRRIDAQDKDQGAALRRIDDIAEELKEGHRRLRRFEHEQGPKVADAFGKVEGTLGALAGRLYDMEERQRTSVNELRGRMDALEKSAGPGVGSELLAQVGGRLDQAQARTTEALRRLEHSFAGLDQRLRAAEGRMEPEGAREAARFEKLAETLARQVEANRAEMMRRLETAEAEGRMERVERALLSVGEQVKTSEERSARAVEAMGREVLRIAQNLHGRMQQVEQSGADQLSRLSDQLGQKVERDMGRLAQGLEQRLVSADDRHALAIERLGTEITRISDRLSERIAQSERRAAASIDEIGRKLADSSDRIEQRYDRASGELAERMRLSEERTAQLLAEAREAMERRAVERAPEPRPDARPAQPVFAPEPPSEPEAGLGIPPQGASSDWRAAAFGAALEPEPVWDPVAAEPEPFPTAGALAAAAAPESRAFAEPSFHAEPEPIFVQPPQPFGARPAATAEPQPFGTAAFGGADVSDALDATSPDFGADDFAGETEFVDPRALRAAAAAGRASSTRQTIQAARAAMAAAPEPEPEPQRSGFGLKKGGKSRLQERLDRQAQKDGSTVRKALIASAVSAAVVGGAYGYMELTNQDLPFGPEPADAAGGALEAQPVAALASAAPAESSRGAEIYAEAVELLDEGKADGVARLTEAANLGYPEAQLHLAGLHAEGQAGVKQDLVQARLWARRAAEGGDPKGMHAYGMFLHGGEGGPRNRPEALQWMLKAAKLGLTDSQVNVAKLYETGDEGIPASKAEAYKWFLIAARNGDPEAEEAAQRLTAQVPAAAQRAAQKAADAFTVDAAA